MKKPTPPPDRRRPGSSQRSSAPSRRIRSLVYRLLALVVLLASFGGGWLWMDYDAFKQTPLAIAPGWIYEITPGMSMKHIAQDLEKQGVVRDANYLRWLARESHLADRIKTGEYEFNPGMLPRDFLEKIVSGKVIQYSLTVVEGWTFKQLLDAVRAQEKLTHTLPETMSEAEVMVRLGYIDQHPEGRFLPDTYLFPKGTTDVDFLKRAHAAMQDRLDHEWTTRLPGLPYASSYDALIMASIVEKETGQAGERSAIAGVFVRRLQKGIRLQTDPTVIYGLGARYDGNIHKRDLDDDNPYNTYRVKGLPPTPIALPGKDALRAALHPDAGSALYFVARGDGSHEFADTLEAHNRNVMKYQIKPHLKEANTARKVPLHPER